MKQHKITKISAKAAIKGVAVQPKTVLTDICRIANQYSDRARKKVRSLLSRKQVINIFQNGSVDQRDALCSYLGDLRLSEYSDILVNVLRTDVSGCVRHEAAYAL